MTTLPPACWRSLPSSIGAHPLGAIAYVLPLPLGASAHLQLGPCADALEAGGEV